MTDASAGARSYRPGAWFAVLGEQVTVLLPPTERSRVAAVWDVVDAGAGLDEVLDVLLAEGLRSLSGFALVARDGERTTLLLRGRVRAEVACGPHVEALDGSTAVTWVERVLAGVTGLALLPEGPVDAAGADGSGPDLPVGDGLVRVSRVDEPAYAGRVAVVPQPEAPQVVDASAPRPAAHDLPLTEPVALHGPSGTADADTTFVPAGPPPPLPPVAPAPGVLDQSPPPVAAEPVARLVLSSGVTVDVDRVVVIGRAPEARRFPAHEQPRLVTVPSPHQEISATHVEVRPGTGADLGTAVATDLGSTNGTVVLQPGLGPEDLRPGIPVQLVPGAVIDLGDGVTIQVQRP